MITKTTRFNLPRYLFVGYLLLMSAQVGAEQPLSVYTVNYPLEFFAEVIGGDRVQAIYPGPSDTDPAFWKPDLQTLQRYQAADLVILNGAGYAKWLGRASLPRLRMVNTMEGLEDRLVETADGPTHSHGPQGDHSHGGVAFTTWLDLELAALQAARIRDAFIAKRPHLSGTLSDSYGYLNNELGALHNNLLEVGRQFGEEALLASHPVYQYLATAYGLTIRAFLLEPDTMPSTTDWRDIAETSERLGARVMIWEAAPDPAIEKRLRDLGIVIVVFSPAATPPAQADFLQQMKANISDLTRTLESVTAQKSPSHMN